MSPAENSKENTHIPELDGIRGVAIALVLMFHFFLEAVVTTPGSPDVARVGTVKTRMDGRRPLFCSVRLLDWWNLVGCTWIFKLLQNVLYPALLSNLAAVRGGGLRVLSTNCLARTWDMHRSSIGCSKGDSRGSHICSLYRTSGWQHKAHSERGAWVALGL